MPTDEDVLRTIRVLVCQGQRVVAVDSKGCHHVHLDRVPPPTPEEVLEGIRDGIRKGIQAAIPPHLLVPGEHAIEPWVQDELLSLIETCVEEALGRLPAPLPAGSHLWYLGGRQRSSDVVAMRNYYDYSDYRCSECRCYPSDVQVLTADGCWVQLCDCLQLRVGLELPPGEV